MHSLAPLWDHLLLPGLLFALPMIAIGAVGGIVLLFVARNGEGGELAELE